MKTIETKITINAPIEFVWRTLMDFENHPQWNPFIKNIAGTAEVGHKLSVTIAPPGGKGMTFNPVVITHLPFNELRWLGKLWFKGIFDGEHYFILNRINHNTTELCHGENFSGLLVSLSGNMLNKTVEGFELMNKALKKECEK